MTELPHDTDDAFHEIQLSGKQLVFLFMATTVVSVVIFLCGVLVGRSVRAQTMAADDPAPAAVPVDVPSGVAADVEPRALGEPAPVSEGELSYPDRLQSEKAPVETLQPRRSETPKPPEPSKPGTRGATERGGEAGVPPPAATAGATARPGTWAVQVISLSERDAADQIVRRLAAKGYPAFLVPPAPGGPTRLYKVQVGRYDDRVEAQRIASRLKQEEKFDPWIVR
ncbi:MAG TPA: SPOR domain-containing protein [Vicinamibacterales bacterium]|nr:SPOR domain-containing protein [Vicinamibacterales bacterium]